MNRMLQAYKTDIRFVPQAFTGAGDRFAGVDEMIEVHHGTCSRFRKLLCFLGAGKLLSIVRGFHI